MKIIEVTKKDGSTVYRTSVYLGVDQITGKKVKTSVTGRTRKEVKQKVKQAETEFKENGATRFTTATISTYEELAKLWWDSYKHTIKPNSVLAMETVLRVHVLPLFGAYKLDKITTPLIQSIVNKLAEDVNKGKKGAYLHYDKIHALNKRILQYGVVMQVIPTNPAREVIWPRNTRKNKGNKVKHLNNQELKIFLDYLETLDLSIYQKLYDVTLYKLLLATGCRISEALALEWSDIDLDNALVHITKTLNRHKQTNSPKSKSSIRTLDIDQGTVKMLKEYKRRQTKEAWKIGQREKVVFSDFINDYPCSQALADRLRRRLRKLGLPNILFHGLRHTHASLLLNSGIPYKELQHRLGHSQISMTMDIYSHLSKESAKKAVSFYETAIENL